MKVKNTHAAASKPHLRTTSNKVACLAEYDSVRWWLVGGRCDLFQLFIEISPTKRRLVFAVKINANC